VLKSLGSLKGYTVHALDGDIGRVDDFYFDDALWVVRHFVVDTGHWRPGEKVLIYPGALERPDSESKTIRARLKKEQIEKSPRREEAKPLSLQYQNALYEHYGWPANWLTGGYYNEILFPKPSEGPSTAIAEEDPHLRSFNEVMGYHLQALNGEIGHIEDFIAEEKEWSLRYIVTDTRNWLPGKRVLVSPEWIEALAWGEGRAYVDLSMEDIKEAPHYDRAKPITRRYEEELFRHYGKEPYWRKRRR
jgi:hypothetical protein